MSPGALLFDDLEAFHLLLDLSAPQKSCALASHIAQGVCDRLKKGSNTCEEPIGSLKMINNSMSVDGTVWQ